MRRGKPDSSAPWIPSVGRWHRARSSRRIEGIHFQDEHSWRPGSSCRSSAGRVPHRRTIQYPHRPIRVRTARSSWRNPAGRGRARGEPQNRASSVSPPRRWRHCRDCATQWHACSRNSRPPGPRAARHSRSAAAAPPQEFLPPSQNAPASVSPSESDGYAANTPVDVPESSLQDGSLQRIRASMPAGTSPEYLSSSRPRRFTGSIYFTT